MNAILLLAFLASIDLATAKNALTELDAMCAADRGRLWGRSVCGPIVFAEPGSRDALRRVDVEVAAARVPDSIGIANTAVQWDGREWTMVMWPLPQNALSRRVLLAHESFHRMQDELGLPMNSPRNAHLDSADARYWLRLEWRALARALATRDVQSVEDALAFRERRRALVDTAAEEERQLEMNEGLAEHTGYALAVPHLPERIAPLVRKLANAEKSDTLARSFAYASGPAWGALIEMKNPRWTRTLKASDDLGALARRAWNIETPPRTREAQYGGDAIRAEEDARAAKKRELVTAMRAKFVDGPVLILPLSQFQFTFDPNSVQPFEDRGTVYQTMEVRDAWGTIIVTGGALLTADYTRLIVPAKGEGYTLTLNEGWERSAGAREGDLTVMKN